MKLKEAKLLFVEDEPFMRESMGAWLARHAERVLCAVDGEEALKILASHKIDLLLTDVRMPGMDGIALVKRIAKVEPRPRVILVTGVADLAVQDAQELGVNAIVEKPIDRQELLRAMEHCLEDVAGGDA